ncbi:MAG TPA: hypothetical protein H9673_03190 [Candidatus Adamsella sp.]|nr:hypothetical protein [Candidatus Adamsella sp.]
MKHNFVIFLILLLTAPACSGAAVLDSRLVTIVPSAAVVKSVPGIKNNSVIDPQNGFHSGLEAVFDIKTNGDDSAYDFVLSSAIETSHGVKNGYFLKDGKLYLMLSNKDRLPLSSAVFDIVSGSPENNPNIIAYPVVNLSGGEFKIQNYNGELCCRIFSGGQQEMTVAQYIGSTPLTRTYSIEQDSAGMYEAVLTLNIYRKP